MEFKSRKVHLKIDDVVIEVRYPSYLEFCEYLESIKDIDPVKEALKLHDKVGEFFAKLGLSRQYFIQLEQNFVQELFEVVTSKKK